MADFDAFTSSEAPATDEDPAADFLAREQDQLAGLEDDHFESADASDAPAAQPTQVASGDDFMAAFESEPAVQTSADMFSSAPTDDSTADAPGDLSAQIGIEPTSEPSNDNVLGYDMLSGGNSAVPPSLDIFHAPGESSTDIFLDGTVGDTIPGLDDLDQQLEAEDTSSDPYASVRSVDTQRKEPEKIRLWREQQVEVLEHKDAQEAEQMTVWREAACKELDDWYRHRDEQFHKAKELNREGEAVFIKERDESVPGHEWERICRLCEFNPKSNRTQKDVSRMRSILLQLKQNPIIKA